MHCDYSWGTSIWAQIQSTFTQTHKVGWRGSETPVTQYRCLYHHYILRVQGHWSWTDCLAWLQQEVGMECLGTAPDEVITDSVTLTIWQFHNIFLMNNFLLKLTGVAWSCEPHLTSSREIGLVAYSFLGHQRYWTFVTKRLLLFMVFTVSRASPFLLSALPFSRDLCYLRMEFGAVRGAAVIIPLVESLIAWIIFLPCLPSGNPCFAVYLRLFSSAWKCFLKLAIKNHFDSDFKFKTQMQSTARTDLALNAFANSTPRSLWRMWLASVAGIPSRELEWMPF